MALCETYSLRDLEYLESEKNYREYFSHALDIRPSARNSHWKSMTESMAINFLSSQENLKIIEDNNFELMEKLITWPILKSNIEFSNLRLKIGYKYFDYCVKQIKNTKCGEDFFLYWQRGPKRADYAIKFFQLNKLKDGLTNDQKVSLLYETLSSDTFCNNEDFFSLFLKNSKEFIQRYSSESKVSSTCLQYFSSFLRKNLYQDKFKLSSKSYQILEKINKLEKKDRQFYLTRYFLESTEVGDLFNLSWSEVNHLSLNYKERETILESLKKLDPLPDNILETNHPRKKIVMSYFMKKFPEYWDHYTKSCVLYMEGKKDFNMGNPTLKCKELMQDKELSSFIDPHLIKRFNKALLPVKAF